MDAGERRVPDALRRWRDFICGPGHPEFTILATIMLLAAGIWGFAELADEVLEGGTRSFDEAVLLAMRNPVDPSDPLGPKWVEELGRDFTALGGLGVLISLALAVIGFLLLEHKRRTALLMTVSIGGGILISLLLKQEFDRPRPDLVPHESYVYTTSFPSGHSMMAAVTYLTLAALIARGRKDGRVKLYLMLMAVLVTITVGTSRVYLGVHWPTDVLAGWTAGAIWALLCWLLAFRLPGGRGGQIEQEGPESGAE